jgi:low temperature requirement protein LtrA
VSAPTTSRTPRLTAVMRDGERVTSLELFFDLVFVLAIAILM